MSDYTIACESRVCRVALRGDLTSASVPPLRAALRSELEGGAAEVVFDLTQTQMLDSTGIGLLVATHNSLAPRQGKLRVIGVSDDIVHLLQSMRLVTRLNVSGRNAA